MYIRRSLSIILLLTLLAGCATTTQSYSAYSTLQLRQELAKQKEQLARNHQAITDQKRDYQDSVNNHPTSGTVYGAGAVGTLEVLANSVGARSASKKIEAIQLELIRRGDWSPNDI